MKEAHNYPFLPPPPGGPSPSLLLDCLETLSPFLPRAETDGPFREDPLFKKREQVGFMLLTTALACGVDLSGKSELNFPKLVADPWTLLLKFVCCGAVDCQDRALGSLPDSEDSLKKPARSAQPDRNNQRRQGLYQAVPRCTCTKNYSTLGERRWLCMCFVDALAWHMCWENIKVKFYEEDENSDVIWEDYAEFRPEDVHHQYGIVFKTPPYRNNLKESEGNVTVYCQLERPSDSAVSEPRKYQYTPNPSRTPTRFVEDITKTHNNTQRETLQSKLTVPTISRGTYDQLSRLACILSRKRPRNAIYARSLQRIPSGVTNNYCPTYQPTNELPKESFVPYPAVTAVPEPINTDSLYDISLFNDLPDLMADDLLNDFMLNDEQHMDISSMTMPIVEAPEDGTSSTVSVHVSEAFTALHQMAGAYSEVSQVISNERFNEYLEAIGSSDVSSQIMSLHVSSSNNVEQYVTDGCAAPVDRPEGSNGTAPTERSKSKSSRKLDWP
ncbi:Nuclear factor NF-kappa-B p105 subunit [Homalodisca vitripennis]|nr:Nuclear factor NF-kappa-B p105 subunit [Homalodisca vitripennis]